MESTTTSGEMIDDVNRSFILVLEDKFELGSEFSDPEQAYYFYCQYGLSRGFSVRKGDNGYFSGTAILKSKVFYCACEGKSGSNDDESSMTPHPSTIKPSPSKPSSKPSPSYKQQIFRTGCKALLRIGRTIDGPWMVKRFDKEHNHVLFNPEQAHLLRTGRLITHSKKSVLEALHSSGIGVSKSYQFLEKQAGGPQMVGFTKKDAFNHMDRRKYFSRIPNGDAQALMKFFKDSSSKDPFFYWNVDLDEEGRLTNFYYRDSRCLADYEMFSDVVNVDTTYRTNKYDLIVAPFVGVNHHRSNVVFGIGFLLNEIIESFQWLFRTFLESMNGVQPKLVFTDQCQAMMAALSSELPQARHRLCQWHICRNAPSHFGKLNNDKVFTKKWSYLMNGVQTADEFEKEWLEMVGKYSLGNRNWFKNMYKLRFRWASVFTQDCFSAGIVATTRSESTNNAIKKLCSSTDTLFEFVNCYEEMNNWRHTELIDDTVIGVPGMKIRDNPLLIQAGKVLTRANYLILEDEVLCALNCFIDEEQQEDIGRDLTCVVSAMPNTSRLHKVKCDLLTNEASCTCHMWETEGILCKHILKIYNRLNVFRLPDWCFLPRWRKDVRRRPLDEQKLNTTTSGGQSSLDGILFVTHIMRVAYDVSNDVKDNIEWRQNLFDQMHNLRAYFHNKINERHGANPGPPETVVQEQNVNVSGFNDPKPPTRRRKICPGTKEKFASHWSTSKKKSSPASKIVKKAKANNPRIEIREVEHTTQPTDPVPFPQLEMDSPIQSVRPEDDTHKQSEDQGNDPTTTSVGIDDMFKANQSSRANGWIDY